MKEPFGISKETAESISKSLSSARLGANVVMPKPPRMRDEVLVALKSGSEAAFTALKDAIQTYEATLNQDEEVGAYLVSTANGKTFHIMTVEHKDGVFVFRGSLEGSKVSLVQHHSQLNVLLTALPRIGAEPYRVGFIPS